MRTFKLYILTFLLLIGFSGCKKYLEKEPRVLASIKTADQLEALINNAPAFTYQANTTPFYSTDDTEIALELYKNGTAVIPLSAIYHYVFNIPQVSTLASDAMWNGEYKKIFTANLVLDYADKVTGNAQTINRVKADAYLIRAYAYWELANYYCMPYSAANAGEQGLPLKKTNSYDESLKRATLQETYDFILSDLMEAKKLAPVEVTASMRWRASQKAIDAFLSRYYLFIGNYDLALQHANSALESSVVTLVDYNTIGAGNTENYANPAVTIKYSALNTMSAAVFLLWNEAYFTRYAQNLNQWNIPSDNLLALYDTTNDLRYSLFMMPNSNRRFAIVTPEAFRYTVFFDGRYLPEGPGIAEILLNKAEAQARKGDVANAMATVNILRAKRMKTRLDLSAANQADALAKVLQERRRELPFSFRWFDIRRFAVNNDPSDDVTVTRTFYKVNDGSVDYNSTQTYTLPVNSRRYMVPINTTEIANSRGQITQNIY